MREDVWALYETKIRKYIRSRVSDPSDAEDLHQEVGIRLIQSEDRMLEVENLESWIYRVATNVITDYYRRKDSVTYLEDVESALRNQDIAAEESNYNSEAAACLLEMAELLPKRYMDAIISSDFNGIPQNELGEKWGISYSGAKNRVQRARRRLKENLIACCEVRSDHQGNIIEFVQKEEQKGKHFCRTCK